MLRARLIPSLCLALCACDAAGEDGGLDPTADTELVSPPAGGCATEDRADRYELGLRRIGERLQVVILDATPAPPSRGDNTWIVRIEDDAGVPQPARIEVTPFMPDHQHGSSIEARIDRGAEDGEFVIERVNFFMPGLWEVTLDLTLDDGSQDAVVFRFCIDP